MEKKKLQKNQKEMNKEHLLLFLNEYLPQIDWEVPTYINEGGCGIFAKHLYNKLLEMGLETEIRILFYISDEDSYKTTNELITHGNYKDKFVEVPHIALYIDNMYIDSEGLGANRIHPAINFIPVTIEHLEEILQSHEFNEIFDKSLEPEIKTEIDKLPEKYEGWHIGTYKNRIDSIVSKEVNDYTKNQVKKISFMNMMQQLLFAHP